MRRFSHVVRQVGEHACDQFTQRAGNTRLDAEWMNGLNMGMTGL
jgi:hypothetical protein